ncbi:MAG: hypothetical protein ABFC34_04570 [Methanobacterium sp.]
MIDFCLEQGLPEPLFEIKSRSLVITLRKYKFTETKKSELSTRQQRAIDYLLKHGKITNSQYREINPEIKEDAALNDLKALVDKGLISLKAGGRYSYYVLCQCIDRD